jgi:hypothetical protein
MRALACLMGLCALVACESSDAALGHVEALPAACQGR